jgi:hypothetical protein
MRHATCSSASPQARGVRHQCWVGVYTLHVQNRRHNKPWAAGMGQKRVLEALPYSGVGAGESSRTSCRSMMVPVVTRSTRSSAPRPSCWVARSGRWCMCQNHGAMQGVGMMGWRTSRVPLANQPFCSPCCRCCRCRHHRDQGSRQGVIIRASNFMQLRCSRRGPRLPAEAHYQVHRQIVGAPGCPTAPGQPGWPHSADSSAERRAPRSRWGRAATGRLRPPGAPPAQLSRPRGRPARRTAAAAPGT